LPMDSTRETVALPLATSPASNNSTIARFIAPGLL
jgi:hypothetical protein